MAFSYFRNKHQRRRRKTAGQRRQRMKNHQRRLVALGLDETKVKKMDCAKMRSLLANPTKVVPETKTEA